MLKDVLFWALAALAVSGGGMVFRFDSMARATYALLTSLLAVGGEVLLLGLDYLGVIVLMMTIEMALMAVFMVMYMMNPAGLMPMTMVHNKRGGAGICGAVFLLLVRDRARAVATDHGEGATRPDRLARHVTDGSSDAHHDDSGHGLVRHHRRPGPPPGALRPARRYSEGLRGGRWGAGRGRPMNLLLFLLLAAALFSIGLFGALTQQSIVMLMMGLELMLGGVIVAAAAIWAYVAPSSADGQVLVVLLVTVMAVEMAVGFAVVTALFRARKADTTDMAAELKE